MAARVGLARRPRFALIVAGVVVALVVVVMLSANIYTDLLWYRELGQSRVFTTMIQTRLLLFALFGVLMAVIVGANIVMAHRLRPSFRPMSLEQQNLDRYRAIVEPHLIALLVGIIAVLGIIAGVSASGRWKTWQLWRNGVRFGIKDEQFHRDVSYFTFTYPFQRFVLGFLFAAVILSIIATAVTYYLFGGIRLQTQGEKVVPAAKAHLSTLLGVFVLLKAVAYYLDQFGLVFSPRGVVTGASYTDVNAQLPALRILVVIAVICAIIFFVNLRFRGWTIPAVGIALLVLSSIVIGFAYPAIIQATRVKPNEINLEKPYIQRNIKATRQAYGLTDVDVKDFKASTNVPTKPIRDDKNTLPHARLLDPNVLKATFEQLQGIKGYYTFPDVLDIDRYTVAGETQDYVVGARELDQTGLATNQRNWLNQHLIFTHGFGLVAVAATDVDPSGKPRFTIKDIPPSGPIAITQPRLYYGERNSNYVIVGTSQDELDRPAAGDLEEKANYEGKGGVSIGGFFRRLLYSVKFGDKNLLLSSAIGGKSKIMYIRQPRQRVQKVAPFLTLDRDPYPAIVDGRIIWIVDGYTTSDGYPYSERKGFGDIVTDARGTATSAAQVNYLRNSVKATVDAYDGTVTLYAWDEQDPVLRTWRKVFPGLVQGRDTMSQALLDHVRYPEDLFNAQRDLLARYHITDPEGFFRQGDLWATPNDPTNEAAKKKLPGYYLLLQIPGAPGPQFTLTSPMVANNKANLTAYLAVNSTSGEDYGKFRVLRLPTDTSFDGPAQVQSRFESFPAASRELSLLRSGGSTVKLGNLLALPVGGAFVYIEPVYVQGAGGDAFPTLQRVFVGFGDKVGFAETLTDALDQVFGSGTSPTPGPSSTPGPGPSGGTAAELKRLAADAEAALAAADAALKRGDFAAYGKAQERLRRDVERIAQLTRATPSSAPSPSTAASPAPSPSWR